MGGRGSGGRPHGGGSQPLTLASELPADDETSKAPTAPAHDAPIEEWTGHIGQIYDQLTEQLNGRQGWVHLVDLRRALGDAPREVQDKALRAMSRSGEFGIAPDSNRKTLTQVDHDATIRIGGQDQHLITRTRRR